MEDSGCAARTAEEFLAHHVALKVDEFSGAILDQKYRLVRLLGEGGMGTVYEAEEEVGGRRVAVKLLSPTAADPVALARFDLEARALFSVQHPNLVRVMDVSAKGPFPYLVMELAHGKNLAEVLREEGALRPVRVARIAVQILGALAAAHERGLIHRDVKPQNVQIAPCSPITDDREDIVKLLDFGLAKDFIGRLPGPGLTQDGVVVGTLQYMAPEQALSKKLDARADIYSVGACMYAALTGQRPFEGNRGTALYRAVLVDDPPHARIIRADLPEVLCAIVHRAMSKHPATRFQTANEMADALMRFIRNSSQPPPLSRTGTASLPTRIPPPSPVPDTVRLAPETTRLPPGASMAPAPKEDRTQTLPPPSPRATQRISNSFTTPATAFPITPPPNPRASIPSAHSLPPVAATSPKAAKRSGFRIFAIAIFVVAILACVLAACATELSALSHQRAFRFFSR